MKPTLATFILALVATFSVARADALTLVGEASLRVLFWDIYHSRLYTADGTYQRYERPLRLEIEYQRDIPSKALVERTGKEWDAQGLNHQNQTAWLDRLHELWPDVKQGDRLALELGEDNRSYFVLNDEPLGAVEDPAFGQYFVDIWLSPSTTRPELRTGLIGAQ